MDKALDNPIWHSLTSRHAHLAQEIGDARLYPAEVAPFAGVRNSSEEVGESLLELVPAGRQVGMLNVMPAFETGWQVVKHFEITQYVWDRDTSTIPADLDAVLLGREHVDRMLELTALVYPAYFRQGTAELGDYFGILDGNRLCAMAGIRMAFDGYQEISAVCTHPDYRGRGYAGRLLHHLIHHIGSQGDIPFLHTEAENDSARKIYDRLGFSLRAILPFFVIEKAMR